MTYLAGDGFGKPRDTARIAAAMTEDLRQYPKHVNNNLATCEEVVFKSITGDNVFRQCRRTLASSSVGQDSNSAFRAWCSCQSVIVTMESVSDSESCCSQNIWCKAS